MTQPSPHIVVLGAGFGGLSFCRSYRGPGNITLVDKQNHHLFQPLLYQVAMSGLSAPEIAAPIRSIVSRQKHITVLMDEAVDVDLENNKLILSAGTLPFDFLILALGGVTSYFGRDDWSQIAPGLKTLEDAMTMRHKILLSFEKAENTSDETERNRLTTIVVVGGGPTGVELAGGMAELTNHVFKRDFRRIDPRQSRILLVEGGSRILSTFPEVLSRKAVEQLQDLGVEVRTDTMVSEISDDRVTFDDGSTIETRNVLWGGGIRANPLADKIKSEKDRSGRLHVSPDLSLPAHPNVFAIGDIAHVTSGDSEVPGVAPAAQQMGRFVAKHIRKIAEGKESQDTFQYKDKGTMATIGRRRAIAWIGRLHLSGIVAWLSWLLVHLITLIGFRNKLLVLTQWFYNYATFSRGARIIVSSSDDVHRAVEKSPGNPDPIQAALSDS
ncbi:MAG: NAD(P)/FAD-dependent oxidoreductase [Rhodothermales bacterium]|nr:NAD(P)/FAD-dependent oxidoreductase [Rhodothermales bacterium]